MNQQSKRRGKKSLPLKAQFSDPDIVVFAGETELAPGAIEKQSFGENISALLGRSKLDVQADWDKAIAQMKFLLEKVSASTKDFDLNEVTFQLGFSAEGRVVFVAKGGVTTTICAKFVRKDKGNSKGSQNG